LVAWPLCRRVCNDSSANVAPGCLQPSSPALRAGPQLQRGTTSRRGGGRFQLVHGPGLRRRTEV